MFPSMGTPPTGDESLTEVDFVDDLTFLCISLPTTAKVNLSATALLFPSLKALQQCPIRVLEAVSADE